MIQIDHPNAVRRISRRNTDRVSFRLVSLSLAENEEWESRFNSQLGNCGCRSGQRYLGYLMPFITFVFLLLFLESPWSFPWLLFSFIMALLLAGAIGKAAGIRKRDKDIRGLIARFYQENQVLTN